MNKIILAIIILGAVGGYAVYSSRSTPSTETQTPSSTASSTPITTESQSQEKFSGSLIDLVSKSAPLTCTFKKNDVNSEVSGTVYMSAGNFRVDYQARIAAAKQTIEGHTIYDGTTSYTWTSLLPQGFKMKIPSIKNLTTADSSSQTSILAAQNDYACRTWTPDTALFTAPTSIQFVELPTPTTKK